jgi:hypothetical protein
VKKKHNLEKATKVLDVISAGVPVRMRLDSDGRPLSASAGYNAGDPYHERFVELAVKAAHNAASHAAQRTKSTADAAAASAQSAKMRAKRSEDHWSNEWFGKAHQAHPKFGKARLARSARQLAAAARIELDKRDEITEDRAQQFLNRQRNPSP